jgi:hypothetical protein
MFPPWPARLQAHGDCSPIPISSRSSANAPGDSAESWCRPSGKENRRAGLLYHFSVGETHYDRNSYPGFIGDGMSKLTSSVAEGGKQTAFQTRDRIGIAVAPNDFEARHGAGQRRHRWRGFARAAGWLMLLRTPRRKSRPIIASVLAVSERTLDRDIAELKVHRRSMTSI